MVKYSIIRNNEHSKEPYSFKGFSDKDIFSLIFDGLLNKNKENLFAKEPGVYTFSLRYEEYSFYFKIAYEYSNEITEDAYTNETIYPHGYIISLFDRLIAPITKDYSNWDYANGKRSKNIFRSYGNKESDMNKYKGNHECKTFINLVMADTNWVREDSLVTHNEGK